MERTRIRRESDRISKLPCDVIDNILKLLPVIDAVRTSILSRAWRYKWVTIPYLVFNRNFRNRLRWLPDSVIYQILFLHKGPILKFSLEADDSFINCPDIDHWLQFLSNHPIEELTLMCRPFGACRPISHHLLTLDHLRHLHLDHVEVNPPSTFKGFGRLVKLNLWNVQFVPGEFKMFIAKCPMLEYLDVAYNRDITYCEDLENIDAPNLKSFRFCGLLTPISFKNAALLTELSIIPWTDPIRNQQVLSIIGRDDSKNDLIKYFHELRSITMLKFHGLILKYLCRLGGPQRLPHNLNLLRTLNLSGICFSYISEVSGAVCLIKSSPNLQSLEIHSLTSYDETGMAITTHFLMMQSLCEFSLTRLEYLKISGLLSWEPVIEFVKLLLLAATVLRKLEINSMLVGTRTEAGSKMFDELLSFRPASPQAVIVFSRPEY